LQPRWEGRLAARNYIKIDIKISLIVVSTSKISSHLSNLILLLAAPESYLFVSHRLGRFATTSLQPRWEGRLAARNYIKIDIKILSIIVFA
jgi:hypothetical protein